MKHDPPRGLGSPTFHVKALARRMRGRKHTMGDTTTFTRAACLLFALGATAGCAADEDETSSAEQAAAGDVQIEIKLSLSADSAARVRDALGLPAPLRRDVWFHDTVDLSLFDRGVIVRTRREPDNGDTTVKVRPADPKRELPRWGSTQGFKCEADKTAAGTQTSCSLKVDRSTEQVTAAATGTVPLSTVLSPEQIAFFGSAAGREATLDSLAALGPIATSVYEVALQPQRKVAIEVWQIGDTRLVEVSAKAPPAEAPGIERVLREWIAAKGLAEDQAAETKTRAALAHLAGEG
jgi:hypothetical protein